MTDQIDLDRLAELVKKAMPGPWEAQETGETSTLRFHRPYPNFTSRDGRVQYLSMGINDAKFITTFDPTTVLALIERVKTAEATVSVMEENESLYQLQITKTKDERDEARETATHLAGLPEWESALEKSLLLEEYDRHFRARKKAEAERDALAAKIEQVRAVLAHEPSECPEHPDGDTVTCGWKRDIISIRRIIDQTKEEA